MTVLENDFTGTGSMCLTVVVDHTFVAKLQSVRLSAKGFQHGTAAGPRTTQHEQQLSALQQSIEVSENALTGRFPE